MPLVHQPLTDFVWINPDFWSDHPNGKNYIARIFSDDNGPDGIRREFVPKAKGRKGFVLRHVVAGDAIEMGSTNVNQNGTVTRHRKWAVVTDIDKNGVTYDPCASTDEALGEAAQRVATMPVSMGAVPVYQRRIRDIIGQINHLKGELEELQVQVQALVQAGVEDLGNRLDIEPPPDVVEHEVAKLGIEQTPIDPLPLEKIQSGPKAQPIIQKPAPEDDEDDFELSEAQLALLRGK